jgi:hypothetical protein
MTLQNSPGSWTHEAENRHFAARTRPDTRVTGGRDAQQGENPG